MTNLNKHINKIDQTQKLTSISIGLVIELKDLSLPKTWALDKDISTLLINQISKMLILSYPNITQTSMIGVGALYDLSQILRRGFPIFKTLDNLVISALKGHEFKPSCVAIGTKDQFSILEFNPAMALRSPLLILPICFIGKAEINNLSNNLENTLMQEIKVEAAFKEDIEDKFGISIANIGFATLADMLGLLASQLISIGLEPIWNLLKAALFDEVSYLAILETGQRLIWNADAKQIRIFSCDKHCYAASKFASSQSFDQYQQINQRFENLFKAHDIAFSSLIINDVSFINQTPTLKDALGFIQNQTKQLASVSTK